jgi:hypothetical protein
MKKTDKEVLLRQALDAAAWLDEAAQHEEDVDQCNGLRECGRILTIFVSIEERTLATRLRERLLTRPDIYDLAMFLHSIGWSAPNDAQFTNLKENVWELSRLATLAYALDSIRLPGEEETNNA